jgi:hypothetical protein
MSRRASIVFHRGATVFAQPFDAGSQTLKGDAVQIAGEVSFNPARTGAPTSASHKTASLLYHQGTPGPLAGLVFQRRPSSGGAIAPARRWGRSASRVPYGDMALSPDGQLLAVTRQDAGAPGADIWITDWQRNVTQKITLDPADDLNPVWLARQSRAGLHGRSAMAMPTCT